MGKKNEEVVVSGKEKGRKCNADLPGKRGGGGGGVGGGGGMFDVNTNLNSTVGRGKRGDLASPPSL